MRAVLIALLVLATVAYSQAQSSNFTGPNCYSRYVDGCKQELNACLDYNARPDCTCYGLTIQCLYSLGCASEDLSNACYAACDANSNSVCIVNSATFSGVSTVLVLGTVLLALLH